MRKILLSLIAVVLSIAPAFPQSTIRVQAPNLVSDGEQFNLTFVIEGETAPSDFQWSVPDEFQLVWGPQKGTSTSISIINGKKTRSSQTTYTYVLLPRKTGTFHLPAATASFKDGPVSSQRPTIEVVSSGNAQPGGAQGQSRSQSSDQGAASTGTIDGSDLFLRLSLSKSRAVIGEPLTATLKLYHRVNIAGFEDARFPSFNGFWNQELQAPSNIEFHREKVGDQLYDAALLRSWTLIPQQAGRLTIEPAELVCQVTVRAPRASTGSIFDSFFQDDYRTLRKRVTTGEQTVTVMPLPSGAPSSFAGGVGSFRISAALTRDSLSTHDAASLKVTVSGKGNVSLLEAPKVNFPPDFEVYDVKMTENTDKSTGRLSGSKTFEYPFIPRSHGDFVLDPVEYSYYDVDAGKYVTLRTQPMDLKVLRGAGDAQDASSAGGQLVPGVIRKDVRDLGSDVRFIVTKAPSLSPGDRFFVLTPAFWFVLVLLPLLAAAFWFVSVTMRKRRSDVVGSRNRAASKMALKRLSRAGEYLSGGLYSAFYEELHRALLGFVSDKLNMDVSDMSKDNIFARMTGAGVSEGMAGDYVSLLEACEFARYSSISGDDAMKNHYDKAVAVISAIDSGLNRGRKAGGKTAAAILIGLCLVGQLPSRAEGACPDSLWQAGVTAYVDGRWGDAVDSWTAVERTGVRNAVLCYNIGNAFFKAEDCPRAILWYERALKLDPSFQDARFNLEFAQEFIQDKIETVPEFFLKTWMRRVRWCLPSNIWAALFLVLLAVALSMCLLFLLSSSSASRKAGFFTGVIMLLLAAVCLDFSVAQRNESRRHDTAIVMKAVSSAKSAPGADSSKDLFILHEGTKVRILDEVGGWNSIELSDGRRGWILSSDMEII